MGISGIVEGSVKIKVYVATGILILVSLVIMGVKHSNLSMAESLSNTLTLEPAYISTLSGIDSILLVPLGGLIVVFIRLTLGIRMLGPFRPILIAIGMNGTGIIVGLLFFILALAVMLYIRPRLVGHGLPYFARLMILLTIVVLIEVVMILAGGALEIDEIARTMFFPIVVLCLAVEGFASVLVEEGKASALWRGGTTLATAVIICFVHDIPGLFEIQLNYPEVIFLLIGGMLIVGKGLNLKLLERANPALKTNNA